MKTVAVIGASADRSKFGNKAVRSYLKHGWTVYPVNLHERKIEGLKCYKSILDLPYKLDRALLYLPPKVTINAKILDQIAEKGIGEVFLNPGTESSAVIERAKDLNLSIILRCAIVDIGDSPANYH